MEILHRLAKVKEIKIHFVIAVAQFYFYTVDYKHGTNGNAFRTMKKVANDVEKESMPHCRQWITEER